MNEINDKDIERINKDIIDLIKKYQNNLKSNAELKLEEKNEIIHIIFNLIIDYYEDNIELYKLFKNNELTFSTIGAEGAVRTMKNLINKFLSYDILKDIINEKLSERKIKIWKKNLS